MSRPSPEEIASFKFGGTCARPRKGIAAVPKKNAVYLKPPGSCNTKWAPDISVNVTVDTCENCTIAILDTTSQVQISDCVDCRIIIGPCVGPVFIMDCTRCEISVASKQVRLRDVTDCTLRTYAPTRESIVIETCSSLRFGAWDVAYPGLAAQFAAAGWDVRSNYWDKVYDFSPPAQALAPKNYAVLPKDVAQLERLGLHRWSDLTITPRGLSDGELVLTKGTFASVAGCECPTLAADGAAYARAPREPPAQPPCDGMAGYGRMFGGGQHSDACATGPAGTRLGWEPAGFQPAGLPTAAPQPAPVAAPKPAAIAVPKPPAVVAAPTSPKSPSVVAAPTAPTSPSVVAAPKPPSAAAPEALTASAVEALMGTSLLGATSRLVRRLVASSVGVLRATVARLLGLPAPKDTSKDAGGAAAEPVAAPPSPAPKTVAAAPCPAPKPKPAADVVATAEGVAGYSRMFGGAQHGDACATGPAGTRQSWESGDPRLRF